MNRICVFLVTAFMFVAAALAQTVPPDSDVVAHVSAATVIILAGEGSGRLNAISTGVIVRPDGVILTAYHGVKDAREVQVRLHTGDVYDQVVLLGRDERRDVAALKISARDLPTLTVGSAAEVKSGDTAYVVSNSNGLAWSASKGIFAASRMADEIPGAGQGYRVLQFTAPVSGGASGGPVVDSKGMLVGIITKGLGPHSDAAFAVPVDAVMGLADGTQNLALGSGAALQMPTNHPAPSSAAIASAKPEDILRAAKTLGITTRTMYFTPDTLAKALANQKTFPTLGLMLVTDERLADLHILIDRPLFTYTFTYSVTDAKTSILLDSGKVTAIDGNTAAGRIAKQLVEKWSKVRKVEDTSKGK
jgi:Trypsin-like peptidase domain